MPNTYVETISPTALTTQQMRVQVGQLLAACSNFYALTAHSDIKDYWWAQIDRARLALQTLYTQLPASAGIDDIPPDGANGLYLRAYDDLDVTEQGMQDHGITTWSDSLLDAIAGVPATALDAVDTTVGHLTTDVGNAAKNITAGAWPLLLLGGLVAVVVLIGLVKFK